MKAKMPSRDLPAVATVAEKPVLLIDASNDLQPTRCRVTGARSKGWEQVLLNQVTNPTMGSHGDPSFIEKATALTGAMHGIGPTDEIEGMFAAQLLKAHEATMEAHRRAVRPGQCNEGFERNLNLANKGSRTFVALVEGLNRHRGKGQQKVTVEHVHVHAGGQAVVGNVTGAGGVAAKSEATP